MRNFFKFSLIAILIMSATFSFAQYPGYAPPQESWSQMWNISNVYRNSVTKDNLGTQKDTIKAQTMYLSIASWGTGRVNNDTFTTNYISGSGKITFTANYLKAQYVATSVNPTINVTLECSSDGVGYFAVPGTSVATVVPTSSVTPTSIGFIVDKQARTYRLKNVVTGDTASVWSNYYFLKDGVLQLK